MKVLCFGSLNIDHTYQVEHFLKPGETASAACYTLHAGGKGLNQAIALARAESEVHMAGCVGTDGEMLLKFMRASGVHTEFVETVPEPTGHAIIQVDSSGQNCILVCHGANAAISQTQVDQTLAHFSAGDVLLLQNEISEISYIAQRAKSLGMELWINPSPITEELLRGDAVRLADWLVVNELELTALMGIDNIPHSVQLFMERYPQKKLVLTLGGQGSLFAWNGNVLRQSALPVTAVDTTGAGDTYLGYFLAVYLRTHSPETALKLASKAAAVAVTRSGAAEAIPKMEELS